MLLASRRPAAAGGGGGGGDNSNNNLDVVQATLSMRLYLRHNYKSLGRLLDDAVANGTVRAVELTITTTFWSLLSDDREGVERTLVGHGRRFKALLDACPMAFGAVTQLTLQKLRYGGPDMDGILTTCTRLEKLSLSWCGPLSELGGFWRVRHARLKEMSISMCFIKIVNLAWLPRLERFTLSGWFLTTDRLVSLGHVPRLTTVTLSHGDIYGEQTMKLSRVLANNTALTDLRLNFKGNNVRKCCLLS